jgi:hypothetical protein
LLSLDDTLNLLATESLRDLYGQDHVRNGGSVTHHPKHKWIVVLDLEGYSASPDPIQVSKLEALEKIVRNAAEDAGLVWDDLFVKDRGDGMILIVPAEVSPIVVAGQLIRAFDAGLCEAASIYSPTHRMRLRVSLHQGLVDGYAGEAINLACHLVDTDVLRSTLRAATSAHLAVIVSDAFHREVIKPGHRLIDPATYGRVVINELKNDPAATVWLHVPGYAKPPGLQRAPGTAADSSPHSLPVPPDASQPLQPKTGVQSTAKKARAKRSAPPPQTVTNNFGGDQVGGDKIVNAPQTYHQNFGGATPHE